jgi:hypothetical protein
MIFIFGIESAQLDGSKSMAIYLPVFNFVIKPEGINDEKH